MFVSVCVKSREEFETLIAPMGLDKVDKGTVGHEGNTAPSSFMDVIDDSFYFGVVEHEENADDSQRFPTTYPFSATVPRIGLALLKVGLSFRGGGGGGGRVDGSCVPSIAPPVGTIDEQHCIVTFGKRWQGMDKGVRSYVAFNVREGMASSGRFATQLGTEAPRRISSALLVSPSLRPSFISIGPIESLLCCVAVQLNRFVFAQMSALMVTFLSHLDVPNACTLVLKNLQKGTAVVQGLMLEQLHDAENDMHILKASQISVNSAVRGGSSVRPSAIYRVLELMNDCKGTAYRESTRRRAYSVTRLDLIGIADLAEMRKTQHPPGQAPSRRYSYSFPQSVLILHHSGAYSTHQLCVC